MAVYANENGSLKDLTSVLNLGNNFIINGIDYIGQYNCNPKDTDYTVTISKGITAYKYFSLIFYVYNELSVPANTIQIIPAAQINNLTTASSYSSSIECLKLVTGVGTAVQSFILFR